MTRPRTVMSCNECRTKRKAFSGLSLAKFRHAGDIAENVGHRSTDMLYKHYRDVIKEQSDIDAFWKLAPP